MKLSSFLVLIPCSLLPLTACSTTVIDAGTAASSGGSGGDPTGGATTSAASSTASTTTASSSGAGGSVPSSCVVPGEASGATVTVASVAMAPRDFAVSADCSVVHVVRYDDVNESAQETIYACPYEGCDPTMLGGKPHLTKTAGGAFVESIGTSLFFASQAYPDDPANPTSFWGGEVHTTSLDLSAPPVLLGQSDLYFAIRSLKRWGDGVVALSSEKGAGANYHYGLTLFQPGNRLALADGSSTVRLLFAARDATEAYVVNEPSGGPSELVKLTLNGAILTKQSASVPNLYLSGGLVATPEALVLFRWSGQGGAFSRCDYDDPTPCLTEKALPAAMGAGITGPFEVAHGRVYTTRTTPTGVSLVYCATSEVVGGTCAWKDLGAPLDPGGTVTKLDHDAEHVYLLAHFGSSSVIERVAR